MSADPGPAPRGRDGEMKTQDSRAHSGTGAGAVEEDGDLVQTHTHGLQRVRLVAPQLDHHLQFNDVKTGRQLAGVGLFVHQEEGQDMYVSRIVPNGAAAMCGMIRVDDELISIDDHFLRPEYDLTTVCLASCLKRERECCLLVLNLVSSTLPCIRQPRPRLHCCKGAPTRLREALAARTWPCGSALTG